MKRLLLSSLVLLISLNFCSAESKDKLYGTAPTVKETTSVSALNAEPTKYKDQTILVAGKIVDVCQGAGCWVEIESADSARVICRSLDESIHFPKDVVGKTIQLQGKVLYDPKASGTAEMKNEGGTAHACPNPKVLVSIDGAIVTEIVAATPAPQTEPKKE